MPDPLKLVDLMTQAISGVPNPGSAMWQREMERVIARGQTAAYIAGMAGRLGVSADSALISPKRLSRAERAELKRVIDAQLAYFAGFVRDLPQMTEAQVAARAQLYPGATQETYYRIRWGDWDVPDTLLPGRQACQASCRCSISIQDNGDGTGALTRVLGGAEVAHCQECPAIAGDHPVRRRGG